MNCVSGDLYLRYITIVLYFNTILSFDFVVMQVVSPYSAEDAKGLIKAAVRDNDPGTLCEMLLCTMLCVIMRRV